MGYPRICEVLGVRVGELFTVDGWDGEYYINEGGWVLSNTPNVKPGSIEFLINYPQNIRHSPRWTEDDIADAKAVLQIWPDTNEITRLSDTSIRICTPVYYNLPSRMFPSLRVGEFVSPDDILEGKYE